jgi:hypothetical protein
MNQRRNRRLTTMATSAPAIKSGISRRMLAPLSEALLGAVGPMVGALPQNPGAPGAAPFLMGVTGTLR